MKINEIRVLAAGIAAGLVIFILGMLFGYITMGMYTGQLWKPFTMMSFVWSVLFSIVFGIIFAAIYALIHESIAGSAALKGFVYGILLWLITLWGLFMTFLTMKVSKFLIAIWAAQGAVTFIAAALVIALIYKD